MIPIRDDNPTELRPVVTVALIIGCCGLFAWQLLGAGNDQGAVFYRYGMTPAVLTGQYELPLDLVAIPAWATLITSQFLHGGFWHLGGNMLYLWIFANNVEDAMGHSKFIAFYLLCGVGAALCQALLDTSSATPVIGASGAISGVLAAYLLLYPTARICMFLPLIFITVFYVRAVWVLGVWFALQLVGSTLQISVADEEGGTAYGAHIGGFVIGLALVGLFKSKALKLHNPLDALRRRRGPDQPSKPQERDTKSALPVDDFGSSGANASPASQSQFDDDDTARKPMDDVKDDRNRLSDLE